MANIRNSISMTDRMTPTLRSILKSMDSMMKVMKNLDKASNNGKQSKAYKQAEKDIKRANNALIKMDNYTQRTGHSASQAATQYGHLGKAVSSVANGMRDVGNSSHFFLQSLASGVYLAQKLANQVSDIMTAADTSRSQVARLGLYNTSQYTNEQLYGQIMRTALNTRSGLTETADLANKILISGVYKGQGAPQAAIGTAEIINKALVAGGGTAEENERALLQLTQGLASGVLQGDELRSIREQTPYFAQVLAEGLSKIDKRFKDIGIGDLKELGSEGKLTAERIVKAMWAMQDEVDADFKQMPQTFGQAVTSLKNIWQYFLYLLSDAEGPLGKINNLMWKLVDYLQTPQGLELINSIATGLDIIVTGILWVMTQIGNLITFLQENSNIAQAIFFALATAAIISAVSTLVAWVGAAWPILLIIALVGVLVYVFLEAGFTIGQIVGAVAGGITWFVGLLWNCVLAVVGFFKGVIAVIGALINNAGLDMQNIGLGIRSFFYGVLSDILGFIADIAEALNKLPFIEFDYSGVTNSAQSFAEKQAADQAQIEENKAAMQDLEDVFTDSYNSVGAFQEGWSSQWYGYGSDFVTDMGNSISDSLAGLDIEGLLSGGTGSLEDMLSNGIPTNGGNLDSVGAIDSDVDISDEDLQLMRDMAARDYLLQVQSVTPVANVTFGDVRETADVNKLVEVIENMVEEQMATALVS